MLVMKQWLKVTALGAFMAVLLMGTFMITPAAHAKGGDDIRIALKGTGSYANAKGTAKYKDRGGEREFQVELENVKSLAGKTVNVYANGTKVGSFRVSMLGVGRFSRNSDRGQNVPAIQAGTTIQLKIKSGAVIVSGSF